MLGAQRFQVRVILVLHEYILDAPVVPPVLPMFDVAGSLAYHLGSTLETASHFLMGNIEAELIPTTFSSLLCSPLCQVVYHPG